MVKRELWPARLVGTCSTTHFVLFYFILFYFASSLPRWGLVEMLACVIHMAEELQYCKLRMATRGIRFGVEKPICSFKRLFIVTNNFM